MKKIIGIYYKAKFTETSFETGCGGSDTWVIQIAKEFVRKGYHTIVFCDCETWQITKSGVEYVPLNLFNMRCEYQHFDYFILNRVVYEDVYNTIVNSGCKNIYLQSHDMFIWDKEAYDETYMYQENKYPYIKKYIALTEFHKNNLMKYNLIPEDKIEIIGNGIDSDIFNKVDRETYYKDNSILFPTVYSRGGDILVKYILPIVKEKIPDFKVRLCGYVQNFPEDVRNNPDVEILGMLTKEEYYREFRKHKVWFLPCTVPEDFGLCACEAAMCECDIISPFKHGMKDVLYPFTPIRMVYSFNTLETNEYHYSRYVLNMSNTDFNVACINAAFRIVESIEDYYDEDRINLRSCIKKFVLDTHTWNNVTNKWINLFNKN